MPGLTRPASALLRSCVRQQLPAVRASAAALTQKRNEATGSSFDSPFKGMASTGTEKIPSFAHYKAGGGETNNKVFSYFMVGTLGALSALGVKATVQGESN